MPTRTSKSYEIRRFACCKKLPLRSSSFRQKKRDFRTSSSSDWLETISGMIWIKLANRSAHNWAGRWNEMRFNFEEIFHFNVSSDITQIFFFIFSFFLPPPARPGLLASLTPSHSAFCVVVEVGGEKSGRWMVCTNRVVWGEKGQRREVKINTEHPKTEVVCRCCYIHTLKSHRKEKNNISTEENSRKV